MILKMFTVFDTKAGAYMPPFYQQSSGQAVRSFDDTVNDKNHAFNKHPEDYILFEIGTYDDSTSKIIQHEKNISLGCAIEFIQDQLFDRSQENLNGV